MNDFRQVLRILAIVLGRKALKWFKQNPEQQKGKGLALAGAIIGTAVLAFLVIAMIVAFSGLLSL